MLLGTVPRAALTVDSYLHLTLELMRQGVAGWKEIVDEAGQGEASSEAIEAIKARMLDEEKKILHKHGFTSKDQLTRFASEHQKEIADRLLADDDRSKEINELTLELNRLLSEYLRATAADPADDADERR